MFKSLREDVEAVFQRDPAARSRLEVVLCYPGIHALVLHRLAHAMWRRRWLVSARWVSQVSRFLMNLSDLKVGQPMAGGESVLGDLGLRAPEKAGTNTAAAGSVGASVAAAGSAVSSSSSAPSF